jgi:Vacuolar transporter chaperone
MHSHFLQVEKGLNVHECFSAVNLAQGLGVGNTSTNTNNTTRKGFFAKLFGPKSNGLEPGSTNMIIGSLSKKREEAIKVEPKVFFANERTFLAWLHSSVLLAGASVAIVSLSRDTLLSQLYGIILLPLAIAFITYSMHQYGRRVQMIRRRSSGPYEDIIGPSVLAVALILSIVAQFTIKLYQILH